MASKIILVRIIDLRGFECLLDLTCIETYRIGTTIILIFVLLYSREEFVFE